MSKGRKVLIGLIALLLLLTAGAYGYGVYYFTGHFLPGSMVNGFNCSYMDQAEAEALLEKETQAYVLAVETRGNGQESISAGDIDLTYVSDGSIRQLMHDQKRFLWFLAFSQSASSEIPSSVSYDEELFSKAVDSLDCMQGDVAPEDAYLKETDDGYEIVPEVAGNTVNREKLMACISDAVTTGKTVVNLETEDCYQNPSVYADSERLIKDCEQLNEMTDVIITYDFEDQSQQLGREEIRSLVSRDEDKDLYLDKERIADYIKKLAEMYDTVGNERSFATYNDRQITVSGGDYGWVIDQEKETKALYDAITAKKTQVRKPVYSQEAASRDSKSDIGYTYVEIDLTNQRLVLYKEGHPVVDTALTSALKLKEGVYYAKELKDPESELWTRNTEDGEEGAFDSGQEADIASESNITDYFGTSGLFDSGDGFSADITTEIPTESVSSFNENVTDEMPLVVYS